MFSWKFLTGSLFTLGRTVSIMQSTTIVVFPSHFVYSAVTVSPESPKRLTSGELRIGPHPHKLECDDRGDRLLHIPPEHLTSFSA